MLHYLGQNEWQSQSSHHHTHTLNKKTGALLTHELAINYNYLYTICDLPIQPSLP